jgi:hypothetical protein
MVYYAEMEIKLPSLDDMKSIRARRGQDELQRGESVFLAHDCRGFGMDMFMPANFYELTDEEAWEQYFRPMWEQMRSHFNTFVKPSA